MQFNLAEAKEVIDNNWMPIWGDKGFEIVWGKTVSTRQKAVFEILGKIA